jgi:hypothetical protein
MIFSISVSALMSKCSRAWKRSDQSQLELAIFDIATESWDPLTHLGGNAFFIGRKSFRNSIRLLWRFAFTKISNQRGKAASAILFGRWETHNEVVLRGKETIGSTFIRWLSRIVSFKSRATNDWGRALWMKTDWIFKQKQEHVSALVDSLIIQKLIKY